MKRAPIAQFIAIAALFLVAAETPAQGQLVADFPPLGEAASYRIESLPLPENELLEGGGLAFRPDGKLLLGTRRGDIWLIDNPLAADLDDIKFKPFARGLHEVLGLTLVGQHDLYLVQRPEVTLLRDSDGDEAADEFTTINDKFGCSGDYHEYIYGPARDAQGNLFVTLNVGFGGGHQSKVPYRGCCLKIGPDRKLTPWAYGLRSPNGLGFSPDGRLYFTDNQGEWVAACKLHEIRQGEYYGHIASVRWWEGKKDGDRPAMTPPAIWFPYALSRSASEPVWDTTGGKFGPFAGQCFVGELTNSLVMRVQLEEVRGRMQGACFEFRRGFECGVNRLRFAPDGSLFVAQTNRGWGSVGGQTHALQRVRYTGNLPLEIHSLSVTPTGWTVRFTRPIVAQTAADPATWFLESYTYHHWATYGSPEIERREDPIARIDVAEDGLSAHLTVPGRKIGRVFHLQAKGLTATDGAALLHPDAWYTLNSVP
jgi:glucose/arabinose dehydrogenase